MCATKSWCVVLAVGILIVGASVVYATPISVANPSFESPVISPAVGGVAFNTAGFLWNYTVGTSGGYYTLDPTGPFPDWVPPPADGGVQVAGMNGGYLYQVLGDTLQANSTYTLTVDVGERKDYVWYGGSIGLGYGSTAGANLLTADTSSTPAPATAEWALWQQTFVTGANPDGLGQPLRIELNGVSQVLLDNVRLDVTTVPEPGALVLLTMGLVSLLCCAWRKRK